MKFLNKILQILIDLFDASPRCHSCLEKAETLSCYECIKDIPFMVCEKCQKKLEESER